MMIFTKQAILTTVLTALSMIQGIKARDASCYPLTLIPQLNTVREIKIENSKPNVFIGTGTEDAFTVQVLNNVEVQAGKPRKDQVYFMWNPEVPGPTLAYFQLFYSDAAIEWYGMDISKADYDHTVCLLYKGPSPKSRLLTNVKGYVQ